MPSRLIMMVAGAMVAALVLAPDSVSRAQDTSTKDADNLLQDVERSLAEEQAEGEALNERSRTLGRDVATLRERLVEAAARVREHEEGISRLEKRLEELALLETEKRRNLDLQREDFAKILQALDRIARFPPEAMIAQPQSPEDTVRTAILLRSLVPEVEHRAARLRFELESLARAREQTATRRSELAAEKAALSAKTGAVEALLAEKRQQQAATEAERAAVAERVAFLAQEAGSLRDLVKRLQEEQRQREAALALTPPKPTPEQSRAHVALTGVPIAERRGRLATPAVGPVAGHFGDVNENGVTLRGIRISTRVGAQVIAPHEGVAVFVGPFRGYGQLLIIEHAGGYHTLLAGMSRIDSVMGQNILSGEPVGVMGGADTDEQALYVELREAGRPIDPLPWIAMQDNLPQG